MTAEVTPSIWGHDDIVRFGLAALEDGGVLGAPLIDGRVLSIMATPANGTSTHMAVGVSVLPADFSTPPHEHEAEELATVLSGSGTITIDGVDHPVVVGSVVLTPSYSTHVTSSDPDGPLVVLWVYTPAGSEERWRALGALGDSGLPNSPSS